MADKKVTLKLENVSKVFAKVESDEVTHALHDVSVTMESGEFVSLVGPSGCGKSTILRLVAGLINPTLGTVTVDGKEVDGPSPDRGVVFQKPTLFPWLTVEKNIAFSLDVQKKLAGNEDKVQRMINVIGLDKFKNDYPAQLSGGQKQRVALARTLVMKPKILLLDEPLSALDGVIKESIKGKIKQVAKELNLATIIVTHDPEEALSLSDRVMIMNGGHILQYAEPEEIINQPKDNFVTEFILKQLEIKRNNILTLFESAGNVGGN